MRRLLHLGLATAIVLSATAAWAASGTDPNDTEGGIDILRSSVGLIQREDGTKRLALLAEAQYPLRIASGEGSIYWQLDTKGSAELDYEVYVFGDPEANDPPGPLYCMVQRPNGAQKTFVTVRVVDDVARCWIPRHLLTIDKSIKWRLAGRLHGVVDRAPDTGWYG
jgi:hypothetical protein